MTQYTTFILLSLALSHPSYATLSTSERVLFQRSPLICYRIPALLKVSENQLMAFAERRYSGINIHNTNVNKNISCADYGNMDIVARVSHDKGNTWGPETIVVDHQFLKKPFSMVNKKEIMVVLDYQTVAAQNIVPFVTAKGKVGVMFDTSTPIRFTNNSFNQQKAVKDGKGERRTWVVHKNGKRWSTPKEITSDVTDPNWSFYFHGPGHGLTFSYDFENLGKQSRILIPTSFNTIEQPSRTFQALAYSDDGGHTWQKQIIPFDTFNGGPFNGSEGQLTVAPDLASVPSGKPALFWSFRVNGGRPSVVLNEDNELEINKDIFRYRFFFKSTNFGETWEKLDQQQVIGHACHGSIIGSKETLYFIYPYRFSAPIPKEQNCSTLNPDSRNRVSQSFYRQDLTLFKLSRSNGKDILEKVETITQPVPQGNSRYSGYSDSIIFNKGSHEMIGFLYETNHSSVDYFQNDCVNLNAIVFDARRL